MKRLLILLMALVLTVSFSGCASPSTDDSVNEPVVNPINLTIAIQKGDNDELVIEDFPAVETDTFIAEEGSSVLEATQLYCISHDISISTDSKGTYVTEINGITEGDYAEMTGWIFSVNGEVGSLGANEQIANEGDEIIWQFVDFSNY